ncbi:hypothetical protein ACFLYO_10860, partial [Chloroflexota bacterium]
MIDLLRGHAPALAWSQANAHLRAGLPDLVWLEVIQGARDKQAQQIALDTLAQFEILHLDRADHIWAMREFPRFHLS